MNRMYLKFNESKEAIETIKYLLENNVRHEGANKIVERVKEGKIKPALVIGVPVGFVNVVESKEIIMQTGIPYIVAVGRKGGSNVAAAICNALIYKLTR